ncbi:MAG: histidine phosphatase family protein [bacterium]
MDVVDLIMVRHGRAAGIDGRCIGHTDVPLSPEGHSAIDRLASHWNAQVAVGRGSVPAHIISSDLSRAHESALAIAAPWGLPVQRDARLREVDFGEWDGRAWADIEREDGAALRAWMDAWQTARPPGGESLDDLLARASDWLREFRGTERATPTVVVSHAGWIRALLTVVFGRHRDAFFELDVDYARVTGVRWSGDAVSILAKNASLFP